MTRETAQALYDAHRSTAVVARVIGRSQSQTCRLLKQLGVKMRSRGGDNMPKKYHNRVGAESKECREPHLLESKALHWPVGRGGARG